MPTPPEAVIGVKLVAAMPEVSEAALIAVDVDNGAMTSPEELLTLNSEHPGVPGELLKSVSYTHLTLTTKRIV